jgi:glycosyltransferase involved in cell wall biosynthesis
MLRQEFEVIHLDTSDRRSRATIGRWDVTNVRLGLKSLRELRRLLSGPKGIVYLPVSQNVPALLRDSLFVVAAKRAGWKVVGHLRGSELERVYRTAPFPIRRWFRYTLGLLDSLAVMGHSVVPALEGLVPRERLAVVPNGTPDPGVRRSDDGSPPMVLFLSNLRRRKGVYEAIAAAGIVLDAMPDVRFVFAGDLDDRTVAAELQKVAKTCDRIELPGPVGDDEKRRLLLSASVLLFPPVEPEGHPRVVLEALAAGLPAVTTDRGAIAETVVDGETGFVLPEPVPGELAEKLLLLLEDDSLRLRMANASRARFLERYTEAKTDATLLAWLRRVVDDRVTAEEGVVSGRASSPAGGVAE